MKQLLILSLLFILSVSCQKLTGENDYQLTNDCAGFKNDIEQNIIKVNVGKGIHYVAVDTTTCTLKVRYEADKVDLSWLQEKLDTLGYLMVAIDSVNTLPDSNVGDSLLTNTSTTETFELTKDSDTWSNASIF